MPISLITCGAGAGPFGARGGRGDPAGVAGWPRVRSRPQDLLLAVLPRRSRDGGGDHPHCPRRPRLQPRRSAGAHPRSRLEALAAAWKLRSAPHNERAATELRLILMQPPARSKWPTLVPHVIREIGILSRW